MPLITTADTLAELPEGLRTHAKEENGKFVVHTFPEGWGIDNVAAVRGKLTKAEQDAKRAAERLKGFAKDDQGTLWESEELKAVIAEHTALKAAQGKAPNIEELRKQIVSEADGRWSKKHADAEKRATDLDRELDNTMLESTINAIVAEMRPKEGKADVARLLLRDRLAIDKTEGGKRHVRVRAQGNDAGWLSDGQSSDGFMPPKTFAMGALRTQHADLFMGDDVSGAGARSTDGSGRKARFVFPASKLNGNVAEYTAMKAQAAKVGETVVIDEKA